VFPQSFRRIFKEGKKSFWKNTLQDFPEVREMGDARESLLLPSTITDLLKTWYIRIS
jgi:hypothetical protein